MCVYSAIMSYGIIFWGNQPQSEKIFKIQKRVIRIITNSRAKDSCRELFKKLEILPFRVEGKILTFAQNVRYDEVLHP